MKKIIFLILLFNVCLVLAQEAKLILSTSTYDFGDVTEGETVSTKVILENQGDIPLIINDVKTQCGCTTTKVSNDPILPSNSQEIEIYFDSSDKHGFVRKSVTFVSNGGVKVFVFTVNVL